MQLSLIRGKETHAVRNLLRLMMQLAIAGLLFICLAQTGARYLFGRTVRREVEALLAGLHAQTPATITEKEIAALPAPVQRWLHRAGVVDRQDPLAARICQRGSLRTGAQQPWLPFSAVEYYTTQRPGLVWHAQWPLAPLLLAEARDRYFRGRGHMLVKALSLFTMTDARGPEMDQGALVRYLNGIMWVPHAAITPYITWQAVDEHTARATIHYGAVTAAALFTFDAEGDCARMEAQRYRYEGNRFVLRRWSTVAEAHEEFQGIRIPVRGQAVWHLEEGEFPYVQIEVREIQYHVTAPC